MRGKVFSAQNTGLKLIQREVNMENMIKKRRKGEGTFRNKELT